MLCIPHAPQRFYSEGGPLVATWLRSHVRHLVFLVSRASPGESVRGRVSIYAKHHRGSSGIGTYNDRPRKARIPTELPFEERWSRT